MASSPIKFIVCVAIAGILAVDAFPQMPSTPQGAGQGMVPGVPPTPQGGPSTPQGLPSAPGGSDGAPGMPGVPAAPGIPGFNFSRSIGFGG